MNCLLTTGPASAPLRPAARPARGLLPPCSREGRPARCALSPSIPNTRLSVLVILSSFPGDPSYLRAPPLAPLGVALRDSPPACRCGGDPLSAASSLWTCGGRGSVQLGRGLLPLSPLPFTGPSQSAVPASPGTQPSRPPLQPASSPRPRPGGARSALQQPGPSPRGRHVCPSCHVPPEHLTCPEPPAEPLGAGLPVLRVCRRHSGSGGTSAGPPRPCLALRVGSAGSRCASLGRMGGQTDGRTDGRLQL